MATTMTLDDLLAKLPAQFKPWAEEYFPVFSAMSVAEFKAWLEMLAKGDLYTAIRQIVDAIPDKAAYLASLDENKEKWDKANAGNADSIALQKKAWTKLGEIMLAIGLAMFGF